MECLILMCIAVFLTVLAVWLNMREADDDEDRPETRPAEPWVAIMEHTIPSGWVPIDGAESEMLFVETELKKAGIEVAFDPRRPGDNYPGYASALPLKLMVKESDLARAREIVEGMGAAGS